MSKHRDDPNRGSNLGWYLIAATVVGTILLMLMAGFVCPRPESWKEHRVGPEDPGGGARPTPGERAPAPGR